MRIIRILAALVFAAAIAGIIAMIAAVALAMHLTPPS